MNKQISILGCGWLGKPLANHLISAGYKVKGSSRTEDGVELLRKNNIKSYQVNVNPEVMCNDLSFFDSEVLIINFPPERRADIETYHIEQFSNLINQLEKSTVKKVLFVSSTSVYANINGLVDESNEEQPEKGSGKALRIVEQLMMSNKTFETTVVRFGGLIGGDRLPGRFLAGKKQVKNGNAPINLIHREDCIQIIESIILKEQWGEVFNACMEEHPLRRDYYIKAAEQLDLEPPVFEDGETAYKVVSSEKLIHKLNYQFKYTNPLELLKDEV